MKIKFLNGKIGVTQLKAPKKDSTLFTVIEDGSYAGRVKYVAESVTDLISVGDKVYFGNQYQQIHLEGAQIYIMDTSNLVAIENEETQEKPKA